MAEKDKIADEIVSEEELDGVSGGGCVETALDSRFLNCLNGSTDRYDDLNIFWSGGSNYKRDEITRAWKALGIDAEISTGVFSNKYYLNGEKIEQEDARLHAMIVTGHFMERSEWNW